MRRLREEIAAAALGPAVADGPDTQAQRFRFGPDFGGFAGHFPGQPVLPAFVEIMAAVVVAEAGRGPLTLTGVRQARFLTKVEPGHELEVRCRCRPDGAAADVKITAAAGPAATFVLEFAPAEAKR